MKKTAIGGGVVLIIWSFFREALAFVADVVTIPHGFVNFAYPLQLFEHVWFRVLVAVAGFCLIYFGAKTDRSKIVNEEKVRRSLEVVDRELPWAFSMSLGALRKAIELISFESVTDAKTFEALLWLLDKYYWLLYEGHKKRCSDGTKRKIMWDIRKMSESFYDDYVELTCWVENIARHASSELAQTREWAEFLEARTQIEHSLKEFLGIRECERIAEFVRFRMADKFGDLGSHNGKIGGNRDVH